MWYSMILKGVGQYFTAISTESSIESMRQTGRHNQALLNQQADYVRMASERETELMSEEATRLKSSQRAAYSKSGAMISSGTPLLVMVEQAGSMQRDILENKRNRLIEEQQLRHAAEMEWYNAKQQGYAARMQGISSFFGGMGNAMSK